LISWVRTGSAMPGVLSPAPEVATVAAAWGLLNLSFFRRRCRKTVRIRAPMPSTPSNTPSPIPAFAPVDNPLSIGLFEGAEGLEVESRDDKSDDALYPTTVMYQHWTTQTSSL
jgi:hypothetical protein